MTRRIDRRQALGTFGTVSLGALLAACGSDRVETTDGGTATVEPETTTSPDAASRFGDDESNIADVVAMALRFQGFAVEAAGTGAEAIAAVSRFRPERSIDLSCADGAVVPGDAHQLRQVLGNLLRNAPVQAAWR